MYLNENKSLCLFLHTLCGMYTNKIQAKKYPRLFPHINIYFRLLPWSLFKEISIYSEQSYDYAPWSPYRQAVHRISIKGEIFILNNYYIKNQQRVAGGGFNLKMLDEIDKENLFLRNNCEMGFRETTQGNYKGQLKKKNKCIIEKEGKKTYLVSNIVVNKTKFISSDEGFDIKTNEKVWGAENGPFEFNRVLSS